MSNRAFGSKPRGLVLTGAILLTMSTSPVWSAPPNFQRSACPVKIDGKNVGTELTAGGSSLRNTVAYEPSTQLYHFWGFVADDANFPSAASALPAVRHATSSDGLHFTSDAFLSYGIGSANYADYGAELDPPLDFFRAVLDADTSTWKLFNWTENDQVAHPSFGDYNYNTSVNDLGTVASNTSVVHQGPLGPGTEGQSIGSFGLVDGKVYLQMDSTLGGVRQYAYIDSITPMVGAQGAEADLYTGTPYCWFITAGCGTTDPRIRAYVHNVGRTLRQSDGTLGTYYTFRDAATSARLDKNIWYIESNDDGATWSAPAKVFADDEVVTIDHQPLDADAGTANFSNVEMLVEPKASRIFFSTQDAAGNYVFVSTNSIAADAIFVNGFEGCGG